MAARDSDMQTIRTLAASSPVAMEQITDVWPDRQGYAAICVTKPADDPGSRLFSIQLRDGEGVLLDAWRTDGDRPLPRMSGSSSGRSDER